jgi:hypothetical protein
MRRPGRARIPVRILPQPGSPNYWKPLQQRASPPHWRRLLRQRPTRCLKRVSESSCTPSLEIKSQRFTDRFGKSVATVTFGEWKSIETYPPTTSDRNCATGFSAARHDNAPTRAIALCDGQPDRSILWRMRHSRSIDGWRGACFELSPDADGGVRRSEPLSAGGEDVSNPERARCRESLPMELTR